MVKAINVYHANIIKVVNKTTVSHGIDVTNSNDTSNLPLIPDVSIQYRCGDNIQFNYMYGILPYTAFDSIVPPDSHYIYILSDHPSRSKNSEYATDKCSLILNGLFNYLKLKNPNSIIVQKRGDDTFLDYLRLGLSKVTICSASTYCLWPALANIKNGGEVYFPLTSLIAG